MDLFTKEGYAKVFFKSVAAVTDIIKIGVDEVAGPILLSD